MQVKSIAILLALIKLPFVIKSFVLSIFELSLKTSFTVLLYPSDANQEKSDPMVAIQAQFRTPLLFADLCMFSRLYCPHFHYEGNYHVQCYLCVVGLICYIIPQTIIMRSGLLQTITNLLFTKTEKTVNKDNNF